MIYSIWTLSPYKCHSRHVSKRDRVPHRGCVPLESKQNPVLGGALGTPTDRGLFKEVVRAGKLGQTPK